MESTSTLDPAITAQNRDLTTVIARERGRLRSFIRQRVGDAGEAEDILQDVLFELVQSTRLLQPIEQVGAWLFRVARNRIIDRFRRRAAAPCAPPEPAPEADHGRALEDLLPSAEAGPAARYARRLLLDEIDAALEELPAAQRDVFIAHEIEGRSFRALAEEYGLSINTLLARKRYAVLHLRARLQHIHDEIQSEERERS